jgi:hypothetical protein
MGDGETIFAYAIPVEVLLEYLCFPLADWLAVSAFPATGTYQSYHAHVPLSQARRENTHLKQRTLFYRDAPSRLTTVNSVAYTWLPGDARQHFAGTPDHRIPIRTTDIRHNPNSYRDLRAVDLN